MNYNSSKNTSHLLSSPLTGTSIGVEVVRDVSVIQLIEGYRLRLGVDISSLFSGITKLRLCTTPIRACHSLARWLPAMLRSMRQCPAVQAITARIRRNSGLLHPISLRAYACLK